MNKQLSYEEYRRVCKWGERHGLLQYPGVTYPTKLGVDPTKITQPEADRPWNRK